MQGRFDRFFFLKMTSPLLPYLHFDEFAFNYLHLVKDRDSCKLHLSLLCTFRFNISFNFTIRSFPFFLNQALGNHEFDLEIEGLIPFLNDVSFPVLAANIDDSKEPSLKGLYSKSTTITIGEETIGIIGYIYSKTNTISPTGNVCSVQSICHSDRQGRN